MSEKARQHRELPERPMADMLHSSANRLWAHMPGHGGRPVVPLGDLYSLDTTETTVTDDLYAPGSGILKAQEAYARAAHAARTLFLHNGSTQGIHIMLEMGCRDGDTVILPRNAHLSATQACVLGGLRIVWVPVYVQGSETFVMPEDVLQAMRAHPEARKVLLTRPDYFGGCMAEDAVRTIAQEAHAMGMQLVVDEAHGAHFPFGGPIASCSELGADAWVQSVHKTLPALTGSAVLHLGHEEDLPDALRILRREQTSSPSFVLMLSMDEARFWMEAEGEKVLKDLRKKAEAIEKMAKFLGYEDPRDTWKATGYVFDPCRVVLRAPQGGRVCLEEMAALGLDAEMGLGDCVVLLLPPSISWQEVEWMQDVLRAIPPRGCLSPMTEPERQPLAEKRMDVRQAALGRLDTVPLKEAAGRIAGVCAGCYPPGVPLVVPGEVLTEETVRRLTDAGPRGRFGTENDEREETIGCADVSCLIWTEP